MTTRKDAVGSSRRRELANAIRALSMDAVQAANSGHPGAPMGMADIAEVLWRDYLKHNPKDPTWWDRDRFVLSNGHGSMLLYSLLHLTGYPLSLEEIRNFRQMGSRTAGHPEVEQDLGIETTTGPLGQGVTNAVGMALAEKMLAASFNTPELTIVDHKTWVFLGDGCLMEGISHEACSLAGTLGLGKLIAFYDDNNISIDGEVGTWFGDDTPKRFEAYGWQVVRDVDGHDAAAIAAAIDEALADTARPTLLCCKTIIGFGSPNKQGTAATHGAPLGDDEIVATRELLGWKHAAFEIPDDIYADWDRKEAGTAAQAAWNEQFALYKKAHAEQAAEYGRRMRGELPDTWEADADAAIARVNAESHKVATRKASLIALNELAPLLPEMSGGSADLTGSNLTKHAQSVVVDHQNAVGNYVYYGVREFGMTAIGNGIRLHGGFIPYSGTFLVFSDYARNALRLAALMQVQNILVYTHDSIGLGEDGPTHQPVEHVASLRIMPNMSVWRPCDAVETIVAWRDALERTSGPTSLVLTRQGVPHQTRDTDQIANIRRGGYVLKDCDGVPDLLMLSTGSEVSLCTDAADVLAAEGIAVRVVSMPNLGLFEQQDRNYRDQVLPPAVTARIAVEAGVAESWYRYVGDAGQIIAMQTFGASAPADELFQHFGFSVDNVVAKAKVLLN